MSVHLLSEKALELIERINLASLALARRENSFRPLTLLRLEYTCFEAGFLRTISWLYMLYYEIGRVSFEFLIEYFSVYNLARKEEAVSHYCVVHSLRTSFQHGLRSDDTHDGAIRIAANEWFLLRCGTTVPSTNNEWQTCLDCLLQESIAFLESVLDIIRQIGEDEFREGIVADWDYRLSRYRPEIEFDQLIKLVATDLGQSHIDASKFRKKHYEQWQKELEIARGNFDFEVQARKLIERDLLSSPVLPITGTDIMREFNISPGPEVGRLLKKAGSLYGLSPYSYEELLEQLRVNYAP